MVWQKKNMDISIQTAVDNPFATPVAHDFGASDGAGAHGIGLTMGDSFMLSRGPFSSSSHSHYQVPMSGSFPWFVAPLAKTRAEERTTGTERHGGGRRRAPHKAVKDPELLEVQRAVTGALIVVRNLSFPKDMPQSKSRDTLGATSSVMASVLRLMQAYPDAFPGRLAERIHEKLTKIVRHFLSWKNREFFFEEDITEPFKECIAILQKARDAMSPDMDHFARASSKMHLVDKVEELSLLCTAVCVAKTRAHEVETTRAHFLLLTEPGSVTQTDLQGSLEVLQPITLVAAKCRRLASEILDLLVKLKEMTKTLVEVRSEIEVAATVNWIVGHYIYIELLVLPRIVERLRGDFFRKGAEASLEALLHHACPCVGPRSSGELQLFGRIHGVVSHLGRALKTHRPLMHLKEEDLLREVDAAVASITTVHAILKELTNRGQKPSYHPVVIKPFLDELQNKITDRKATLRLLDALLDRMAIDRREDPKLLSLKEGANSLTNGATSSSATNAGVVVVGGGGPPPPPLSNGSSCLDTSSPEAKVVGLRASPSPSSNEAFSANRRVAAAVSSSGQGGADSAPESETACGGGGATGTSACSPSLVAVGTGGLSSLLLPSSHSSRGISQLEVCASSSSLYACNSSALQQAHNQYLLLQARQQLVRTLQQQPKFDVLRERYQRTLQQRPARQPQSQSQQQHQHHHPQQPPPQQPPPQPQTQHSSERSVGGSLAHQIGTSLDLKGQQVVLVDALTPAADQDNRAHASVNGDLGVRLDSASSSSHADFVSSVNSQTLCEDPLQQHSVFASSAVDAFQLPPSGYRALFSDSAADVADSLSASTSPWATAQSAGVADHSSTLLQNSPEVEAAQTADGEEASCFDVTQAALDYIARSMAQTSLGHLSDVDSASPDAASDATKVAQV